jgi:hypothetical protein
MGGALPPALDRLLGVLIRHRGNLTLYTLLFQRRWQSNTKILNAWTRFRDISFILRKLPVKIEPAYLSELEFPGHTTRRDQKTNKDCLYVK